MNLAAAMEVLNVALATAVQVSGMIQKAQAEGRTEFSPEEWKTIQDAEAAARDSLTTAIANAGG